MYTLYIVECSDQTLYTGIARDPYKRLVQHNAGTGAKYTRSRRPVRLVYTESMKTRGEALKREYEIKKWSRQRKIDLVRQSE
jgi:putative endonuclease